MFIIDILIFFIIFSLVVFVHEFGHFLGARLTNVKVEEFGIGFPPKIWKKKIKETEYFIGALPFGGYTKIYGMDDIDDEKDKDPHGYEKQGPWAKALICLGGVIMNIIFAAFIFYFLIASSGFKMSQVMILEDYKFPFGEQVNYPLIIEVDENSPAALAGLKSRDVIMKINGEEVKSLEQFSKTIETLRGKSAVLTIIDGQTQIFKEVTLVPRIEEVEGEGPVGIGLTEMAYINYKTWPDKIFCGFEHAYNYMDFSVRALGSMIAESVREKNIQPLADSMSGPVGIFAVTKVVSREGIVALINFVALLSVALGISNLLPIPAMDGAKAIFVFLEAINKKIFNKNLLAQLEKYGILFLIILAIAMVFKDFFQFKDIILK
ncbi:MAG TPA: M50 family metallopeptidase [Candidatus Paceibacterota bacterium]|jgi:regulator of sigma E protease|nr:M50 family metallopeptidase [Candidatus Paceibacterota bacterium]